MDEGLISPLGALGLPTNCYLFFSGALFCVPLPPHPVRCLSFLAFFLHATSCYSFAHRDRHNSIGIFKSERTVSINLSDGISYCALYCNNDMVVSRKPRALN
jgi:hypothetical protein